MNITGDSWLLVRRPQLGDHDPEGWAVLVPEHGSVYWSTDQGELVQAPLIADPHGDLRERVVAFPEAPELGLADWEGHGAVDFERGVTEAEVPTMRYLEKFCRALEVIGQRLELAARESV